MVVPPFEPILSIWNANVHLNCVHDRVYIVSKRTRTFLLMYHVRCGIPFNEYQPFVPTHYHAFEYIREDVAFPPILSAR